MDIHTARVMAASAGLKDVLDAAVNLRFRGAVIDVLLKLGAAMDDAARLADQLMAER